MTLFIFAELSLLTTDDEQLLILSLPQANSNGKIQVHAPVFHRARKAAIEEVDCHGHEGVDVNQV